MRLTRTRSTTSARARAKGKGKGKGECWTCGEVGHRAAECSRGGWYGKGGKGKSGQWNANKKGDGKGSKGGWTAPMVRACFGCGSTAHLIQACPHRTTQKVQEVREVMEEPEILFIGHTAIVEDHESWQEISPRRKTCKGLRCSTPPGLDKVMTNSFRVLREDEDEDDDEDEEMSYVRAVDSQVCASGMTGTTDRKSWASLWNG